MDYYGTCLFITSNLYAILTYMKGILNNVIIKITSEDKTEDGIYKGQVMETHTKGEVVCVGSLVKDVKVGDMVVFSPTVYEEIDGFAKVEEMDIWYII